MRHGQVAAPGQEFVVVSGLPRSGTSLMMQMLRAGGLEPMTDGRRAPDEDNPAGYWEWEEIWRLPQNPLLIEKAQGKATKIMGDPVSRARGRPRTLVRKNRRLPRRGVAPLARGHGRMRETRPLPQQEKHGRILFPTLQRID